MIRVRGKNERPAVSLAELRRELGISQTAVAAELAKSQAATHKTEWSADPLVSTMTEYIRALGRLRNEPAALHLTARIGRREFTIALPRDDGDADRAARSPSSTSDRPRPTDFATGDAKAIRTQTSSDRGARAVIAALDPAVVRVAQDAVVDLVRRTEAAGRRGVVVDHLEEVGDFFTAFAREAGRPIAGGVLFGGRSGEPGLWHALQELRPIDDTNQWNALRRAVVAELIAQHRWDRIGSSPRASEFKVLDTP